MLNNHIIVISNAKIILLFQKFGDLNIPSKTRTTARIHILCVLKITRKGVLTNNRRGNPCHRGDFEI